MQTIAKMVKYNSILCFVVMILVIILLSSVTKVTSEVVESNELNTNVGSESTMTTRHASPSLPSCSKKDRQSIAFHHHQVIHNDIDEDKCNKCPPECVLKTQCEIKMDILILFVAIFIVVIMVCIHLQQKGTSSPPSKYQTLKVRHLLCINSNDYTRDDNGTHTICRWMVCDNDDTEIQECTLHFED